MFLYLCPLAFIIVLIVRIVYVLRFKTATTLPDKNVKTLIVFGSGGHTFEMTKLVTNLNPELYKPRLYVLADTDSSSKWKIISIENRFRSNDYSVKEIPRSRQVKQSYFTSIFTTLYSFISCIPTVLFFRPDLILCNGPGTCIPICIIGFLSKVFFISDTKIVFIESICRVKTLSLSGRILINFADKVLVQWKDLHDKYPKTEYIGRLM